MTNVVLLMRRVVKEVLVAQLPACFRRESIGLPVECACSGKLKASGASGVGGGGEGAIKLCAEITPSSFGRRRPRPFVLRIGT